MVRNYIVKKYLKKEKKKKNALKYLKTETWLYAFKALGDGQL